MMDQEGKKKYHLGFFNASLENFQGSLQGLRTGKNCRTAIDDDLANQGIFHAC